MTMLKGTESNAANKKKFSDDGSTYIFPVGQAAPGASFAPATPQTVPSPQEIAAQVVEPQIAAASQVPSSVNFVNAPDSAPVADRSVATVSMAPAPVNTSSPNIPDYSGQMDGLINNYQKETGAIEAKVQETERLKQEALENHQKKMDEEKEALTNIEPKNYFHGKNTWQKILGGVGLFLGSITPEGARNVANIIDKEIERDIDAQKTNIQLKRDSADKDYQRLLQKFGSQEAALLAKKKGAFELLGLQIKKLEMNARNAETRAKLGIAGQEIQLKGKALDIDIFKASMKAQQEAAKNSVPGYGGAPLDPASKKAFAASVAGAQTIRTSLSELKKIIGGTGESIPFTKANDRAKQLVNDVQLRLKDILNLGVLSESDDIRLRQYVSNPSLFTSDSRALAEIDGVLQLVEASVSAQAGSLGQFKIVPQGARKKQ